MPPNAEPSDNPRDQEAPSDRTEVCNQHNYPGIGYTNRCVLNIQKSDAFLASCLGLKWTTDVYALYHEDPVTKPQFDKWLKYRAYLKKLFNLARPPNIHGIDLFKHYQDPQFKPLLNNIYPARVEKTSENLVNRTNIVSLGTLWYIYQLVKGKRDLFPRSRVTDTGTVTELDPYDLLHAWKLLSGKMYHQKQRNVQPKKAQELEWCTCKLHPANEGRPVVKSPDSGVSGAESVRDETDVGTDTNYGYTTEEMYEADDEVESSQEPPSEDETWNEMTDVEIFGTVEQGEDLWNEEENRELFGTDEESDLWDEKANNELFDMT
ncbi:hypothetical protein BO94DRAFT_572500 [Aspergillus sclerotioniger CBS 115572]|uniref:Uncharacterized protein n=1 Tax=Aspergillus sclerotioniger CBS 115572 TaxID=1450535 RepID=A0A317X6I8_9EURO|nr:hypothetical protein BO94DRAFT_572500 [Aspergillus sclerotioniger CBS 115572]PWY93955.1 hypothetical protein BO94DRAFT_572500 [Aspergillus sclerotioniger CBS 115572]